MSDQNKRPSVTIEDLLQLKRAERPSQEFWVRFEGELRQKQLAALLERRPWWQSAAHLFAGRRIFVPVGAAAALALALGSMKYFAPEQVASAKSPGAVPAIAAVEKSETIAKSVAPAAMVEHAMPAAIVRNDEPQPAPVVALSSNLPERATDLVLWNARTSDASVADLIRVDQAETTEVANDRFFAAVSQLQKPGVTPADLPAVTAATSKRSRLLAQFGERYYAPEPQAPKSVRDRVTRQLADTDFSDRFSRIGVKGDQVSLKF
jgi:hypothetical protein